LNVAGELELTRGSILGEDGLEFCHLEGKERSFEN